MLGDGVSNLFFCTAGRGTEEFAASEIREKLSRNEEVFKIDGKVFFALDKETELTKILQLKTVERIFVQLCHHETEKSVKSIRRAFAIHKFLQKSILKKEILECCLKLHQQVSKKEEPSSAKKMKMTDTPSFRMSCKCSGAISSQVSEQFLSKAIGSRLAVLMGWNINLRNPDIEVCIHINDDFITAGIPLTREPLSKRNYICHSGLRAPIAWIMCHLADIKAGDVVLDPMCGKATILVEGASQFQGTQFIGCDVDSSQLGLAAENIQCLYWGKSKQIDVLQADATDLPFNSSSVNAVVCDVPFGLKFIPKTSIKKFYPRVLSEMHRVLQKGGKAVILTTHLLLQLIRKICYLEPNVSALSNRYKMFSGKAGLKPNLTGISSSGCTSESLQSVHTTSGPTEFLHESNSDIPLALSQVLRNMSL